MLLFMSCCWPGSLFVKGRWEHSLRSDTPSVNMSVTKCHHPHPLTMLTWEHPQVTREVALWPPSGLNTWPICHNITSTPLVDCQTPYQKDVSSILCWWNWPQPLNIHYGRIAFKLTMFCQWWVLKKEIIYECWLGLVAWLGQMLRRRHHNFRRVTRRGTSNQKYLKKNYLTFKLRMKIFVQSETVWFYQYAPQ